MNLFGHDLHEVCDHIIGMTNHKYGTALKKPYGDYTDVMHKRWYEEGGLEARDFSFYSEPEYVAMAIDCYLGWTKGNVTNSIKFMTDFTTFTPQTIFDFGAGIGLSTLQLAQAFPSATVIYNNVDGAQKDMFNELIWWLNVPNVAFSNSLVPTEMVCAYEVFEHFERPDIEAELLLNNAITQFYFDATSFSIDSPGHFPTYLIGNQPFGQKQAKRHFNALIRSFGYKPTQMLGAKKFFNSRPTVYVRDSAVQYLKEVA